MHPKTILVCGGRDYRNKAHIDGVLSDLDKRWGLVTLIHGGASGVDTIAGQWGKEWGLTVHVHPADWAKHGTKAGPIRNQDMLERGKPDMVVAFPGGRGTADMVRRAKAARIPVYEAAPWDRCPSTHCQRRGECSSPNECIIKSPAK